MFSIANAARSLLSIIAATFYMLLSLFTSGFSVKNELPAAPDDFTPVMRFAVCSDVHISGEEGQAEPERFADMINTVYAYAADSVYTGVDAIAVAGDFTNNGSAEQYDVFTGVADANIQEGTEFIVCMGNHEFSSYRGTDVTQAARAFEEKLGHDTNTHYILNGYHFIALSYDDDGKSFTDNASWLRAQLDAAVADTGDKPIFLIQHPAPSGTIYGSINWGDPVVTALLAKYPQVVDFSGHSHYPVNDPRSIWQGTFTALGCGTLSYFETELDCVAGNFPYDYGNAAQFYIVEADAAGNVRIQAYDLITHQFFDLEYYLTDLANSKKPYSYSNLKSLDSAPVFGDDTVISAAKNEAGETVLTFTGACDTFVTESYKMSVTCNGIKVFNDNFSGKYMYLYEDDIYNVNLGELQSGKKYSVQIVAMNAFAELSAPLCYTFTAE